MTALLRKYATATTISFPLVDRGTLDFEATPVTIATGDVKVSKDGGAFNNTTNLFAHLSGGVYTLTLTATEMTAATVDILIKDQTATKEWEDTMFKIETYGNASAQHEFDLDTALTPTTIWAAATRTLTAGLITAADVWAYATRTITGGGGSAADIWGYATRTLTQSAASVTSAVSGSTITILRGDTLTATLTGLGNISSRTGLHFTVKTLMSDYDSQAILQVKETTGLLYLNAATTTAAWGSITVNDAVTGSITITVSANATVSLLKMAAGYYDVQMLTATAVQTLTSGTAVITEDVTRLTA